MAESRTAQYALRTTQSKIPEAFLERMAGLLGAEYGAFLASYDAPASVGLRVNTLKISVEAFCALAPFDLTPVPWCPAGCVVKTSPPTPPLRGEGRRSPPSLAGKGVGGLGPGKHPYHAAGLYYLQDLSAMAVAELLDPQPGERVLDLAAAPGGKATHIASLMRGEGLLIANEIHPQRAWELAGNLERWGARNVAVTNETPERLAERFPGFFDRVLVDAPCSGEGMLRKGEAARREWAPALVRGCALRQTGILAHAALLVRPGGRLVYSTCTFNPEENEGTVARFLTDHPDFALVEPPRQPGFSPGRPEWIGAGADLASGPRTADLGAGLEASAGLVVPARNRLKPRLQPVPSAASSATDVLQMSSLSRAVRLWPHLAPGEGHFIAVLERAADGPADPPIKPGMPASPPRAAAAAYRTFCADHLAAAPAAERLALIGSYLYALPAALPDLTGLRCLHPGWWLGTIKKDRFEPSHALALGLRPEDARRVLALPADAPELAAYLRGELFRSPGEDGWTLVCVDGHPLGWGKRVKGAIKSHYPRGLRWA